MKPIFFYIIIVLAIAACILLLPNLCLVVCLRRGWPFRLVNFGIFVAYSVLMAAYLFDWGSFAYYFGFIFFLFPVIVTSHFVYLTFAWQKSRPSRAWKIIKFVVVFLIMTAVCSSIWDNVVNEYLYDCTDAVMLDYFRPGDWVHTWDGNSLIYVDHIVHGRSMSEPDAIKKGWSVAGLWGLWLSFISFSVIISIALAWLPWIPGRIKQNLPAAT